MKEEEYVLLGALALTLIGNLLIWVHELKILVYIHFVIKITSQFARVLKIHIFKLGSRDAEGLRYLE